MPPKKRLSEPQEALPGLGETAQASRYFDQRAAFGRVPTAEFARTDPEGLKEGLGEEDFSRVQPAKIEAGLFGGGGRFSHNGLALRPDEHEVLIGNHEAFTSRIAGKTLIARGLQDLDRRLVSADHSQTLALISKKKRMEGMLKGYDQEKQDIERLLKEMHSPGYAHMSEIDLLTLAASVKSLTFINMLDVVALKERWDSATLDKARNAMYYLAASEHYRSNFQYWQSMTPVALRYTTRRQTLTKINLAKTVRLIEASS